MAESLKAKTFKGTVWSAIERFSVQGIQFIVMLIMARILTPEDYGIVGMLAIFIAISQSLIDSGFSQALIRKNDRNEIDYSTVFYFNCVIGIILYIVLYFAAPLIASFYNEPILIPVTRTIAIGLVLNSLVIVQRAQFTLALNFKTQAKATFTGAIISGIIGISMAYSGYGVWSIVIQQISNLGIVAFLLWLFSKWIPKWLFSWKSFKELFNFGSKLLLSGLLNTFYTNLYLIVIGKIFKASDLGYYTRAHQFSDFASSNITGIIQRVSYPVLCSIQNEDTRLRICYQKFLKISAFIVFPLLLLIASISKPLIITILTEKWAYSSILLVPLCLSGIWFPIHAINLNLLQVKGRSDLFLKLEIIKKLIGVVILCVTIPLGLLAICWGTLLNSLISLVINTHYTGKLLDLGLIRQLRDLVPILLVSFFTAIIVWISMTTLPLSEWILLLIGIVEGIVIYFLLAMIFLKSEFQEVKNLIRKNE